MKVHLLVVQGRPQGKRLAFPVGEYVFGRGAECHVRPNSDWVSRQHCMLRVTPDALFVRDLGSRNGTLVNGVRLRDECRLGHGDQVQVGPLVFEVCLEEVRPPVPAGTGDTGIFSRDTLEFPSAGPEAPAEPVRDRPGAPAPPVS